MTERKAGGGSGSNEERQRVVDHLCQAFAEDRLSVEEFERRVDVAHRARDSRELKALLEDLPEESTLPVPRDTRKGTEAARRTGDASVARSGGSPPVHASEQGVILGFLGGGVRRGAWNPARYNYAVGVMGGVELDLRHCALPPETHIRCFAVMGGVEVVVPPDVVVVTSGVGILGGFEHVSMEREAPPGAPVVKISGIAVLGGVDVTVRYPGESVKEAKRRKKEEQE